MHSGTCCGYKYNLVIIVISLSMITCLHEFTPLHNLAKKLFPKQHCLSNIATALRHVEGDLINTLQSLVHVIQQHLLPLKQQLNIKVFLFYS